MKLRFITTTFAILMACLSMKVSAWGPLGHDAVAYIAECNLTPKAKANIERYLGNLSIVYYASWLDRVRPEEHYRHASRWHAFDVDSKGVYYPSRTRDAVEGVNKTLEQLRNHKNLSDSAVADNIKILTHIVGDMHCPAHAFYTGYEQKKITFKLRGREFTVHTFWDEGALDQHKWNYIEYQHQLDRCTPEQIKAIAAGTPEDWANETGAIMTTTYDWFANGGNYGKTPTLKYLLNADEIAHPQILKAGYRLARLFNEIFDY